MTEEYFDPSDQDIRLGIEGYLRYLSGVAILNAPKSIFSRGAIGEGVRNPRLIVVHAETLMYDGLKRVIKHASPEEFRGDLAKAEHHYDEAVPNMESIVANAFDSDEHRIEKMNSAFLARRPKPMITDEPTYKYLCHSRKGMLQTVSLMDGVQPAAVLMNIVQNRAIGDEDRDAAGL